MNKSDVLVPEMQDNIYASPSTWQKLDLTLAQLNHVLHVVLVPTGRLATRAQLSNLDLSFFFILKKRPKVCCGLLTDIINLWHPDRLADQERQCIGDRGRIYADVDPGKRFLRARLISVPVGSGAGQMR